MYKSVKKTKFIRKYMEALAIYIGAPTVHWEDNTSCISVVEAKIVTPRVKHIYITICFLQEQFDNVLFLPKHEKSSVMTADMCTKPCSGHIIIRSTKCMTGFRLYPAIETERYQFMILYELVVK